MRTLMAALGAAAVGVLSLASGCGGPPALQQGDALAGACQFKPCVCADANATIWRQAKTAPIIWSTETGAPTCPTGFVLRRTDEKQKQ